MNKYLPLLILVSIMSANFAIGQKHYIDPITLNCDIKKQFNNQSEFIRNNRLFKDNLQFLDSIEIKFKKAIIVDSFLIVLSDINKIHHLNIVTVTKINNNGNNELMSATYSTYSFYNPNHKDLLNIEFGKSKKTLGSVKGYIGELYEFENDSFKIKNDHYKFYAVRIVQHQSKLIKCALVGGVGLLGAITLNSGRKFYYNKYCNESFSKRDYNISEGLRISSNLVLGGSILLSGYIMIK